MKTDERERRNPVTFRVDDRGRVPFALIGVLLLVSATTIATVPPGGGYVDRNPSIAGDRALAATETVVRDATQQAGAQAAANPVVEPATSGFGVVLEQERPFRSYLELLVYLRASERLDDVEERVGKAQARASLPPIENETDARSAIARTTVEAVGNGSVRVTIEDVELVIWVDGRIVDRERRTIETTVATPALTLHDRTMEYEKALNRTPLAGPGLGNELTGRLYALGWARGNAQYWGAPIEEVIAHRHVELSTAGGALDLQRSTFGTADEDGEQGLARATARIAADDLLPGRLAGLAAAGLPDPNVDPDETNDVTTPSAPQTSVEVGVTADRAFEELLTGEGRDFDAVLTDAYALDGRLTTLTNRRSSRLVDTESPPGGYSLVRSRESVRVENARLQAVPKPPVPDGWDRVTSFGHVVEAERVVTRVWTDGENRTRTRTRYAEKHAVGTTVLARASGSPEVPSRPVHDLRSPGGPAHEGIDGYAAVIEQLVDGRGGEQSIAKRAVTGDIDGAPETVYVEVPDGVRAWVYDDVANLRDDVRDVNTEVDSARLAVGENPSTQLAETLDDRRGEFVDPPGEYDDRADRARVAARVAYLSHAVEQLHTDAGDLDSIQDALAGQVDRISAVPQAALDDLLAAGMDHVRPEPQPLKRDPPGGGLQLTVDAEPAYLTREQVEAVGPRGDPPTSEYHPLGIRTGTVASLPTDAIADAVVDRLFDDADRVPLPTAARALEGAENVPDGVAPEGFERQRSALRTEVEAGVDELADEAVDALAETTELSRTAREAAVENGLEQWDDPAARALAIDDGEAARSIALEVMLQTDDDDPDRVRDRSETRLRVAMASVMTDAEAQISEGIVIETIDATREATREVARAATEHGEEHLKEQLDDRLDGGASMTPAGVPVLPKPGLWWATVNVWTVEVQGTYAAFSIRTPTGAPETGGHVTYVRDGTPVEVDVTGDGTTERLGVASRVSFETWTAVVVAVPPGRTGVGDVDGDAVECSEGWLGECLPQP